MQILQDKKCSNKVAQLDAFYKFYSESSFQRESEVNLLKMSIKKSVTQIIFREFAIHYRSLTRGVFTKIYKNLLASYFSEHA